MKQPGKRGWVVSGRIHPFGPDIPISKRNNLQVKRVDIGRFSIQFWFVFVEFEKRFNERIENRESSFFLYPRPSHLELARKINQRKEAGARRKEWNRWRIVCDDDCDAPSGASHFKFFSSIHHGKKRGRRRRRSSVQICQWINLHPFYSCTLSSGLTINKDTTDTRVSVLRRELSASVRQTTENSLDDGCLAKTAETLAFDKGLLSI